MKSMSSKQPSWLFSTISGEVALAPTLNADAWMRAEIAKQEPLQQFIERDFTVVSSAVSPARKAMAGFAKGTLPSPDAVAAVLETMMDPEKGPLAMEIKGDALGIEDPRGLAEVLVELGSLDRQLFDHCVSGHFKDAIRRVPGSGYASSCGTNDWPVEDVLNVIDHLLRYWLLDQLHGEALKCGERIYHPTGCDALDGGFTGSAPRMGAIAARIDRELQLLEKVSEFYHRDLRSQKRSLNEANDVVGTLLVFRTSVAVCNSSAFAVSLCRYGRPASVEETAFLRDLGLEAVAKWELDRLRREHGDQLEAIIEARMDFARRKMGQLRGEIDAIRNGGGRQRAYTRFGITPLARLWLACEAAVAWSLPGKLGEKSPLTLAVKGIRAGGSVRRPKPHKSNVRKIRELFYALRCTTVQDPDHLPETLREVTLPGGQKKIGGTHSNVVRMRGTITFEEIWAECEAGDTHMGREAFSTRFSGEANRFLKAHRRVKCDHCRGQRPCPIVVGRWQVAERWLRR